MGLYLTVLLNKKCSNCGKKIDEWQSKDITDKLGYILETYQKVKLKDIKQGEAHAFCRHCRFWTDILIENGKVISEKSYKLKQK